jgi:enoyl-CoA hydratase/carnithine racemase
MSEQEVTVEKVDNVALVGWHRPDTNYFDVALIRQIGEVLGSLSDDDAVRCVVLFSEGRHFCAGANFSGSDEISANPWPLYEAGLSLFEFPLPMVAAVQGVAVGGGLGVALAADFRVATPSTRFHANFSRLGFHQGFGISVTLPEVVGRQRALQMLYGAKAVSGEEALSIGLADQLAPADQLLESAVSFATAIASNGPLALRAIRKTMREGFVERVRAAMEKEAHEQKILGATEDFKEGVRASTERRSPNFSGR